jgi:uncharacterized membrane protein YkoI
MAGTVGSLVKRRVNQRTYIMKIGRIGIRFTGEEYLLHAKMAPVQARQVALKAYPGKVISEELKKDSGGSGLRYSFLISNQKTKHEVGVDAKTGTVLENSVEGKTSD